MCTIINKVSFVTSYSSAPIIQLSSSKDSITVRKCINTVNMANIDTSMAICNISKLRQILNFGSEMYQLIGVKILRWRNIYTTTRLKKLTYLGIKNKLRYDNASPVMIFNKITLGPKYEYGGVLFIRASNQKEILSL